MAQKEGIKIYGTLVSAMKDHKLAHADEIVADVTGVEGTNVRDILEELASKVSNDNSDNSTETQDSHKVYVDETNKRIVLVLPAAVNTTILYSPTSTPVNTYVKMTINKRYYDFLVNGNDLQHDVTVTATNGFRIKRLTDADSVTRLSLAKEEINPGEGVTVRIIPAAGANPNGRTGTIAVQSDGEEFSTRYINVQFGEKMPNTADHGSYTPGSDSGSNSGLGPTIPTDTSEITN